MMRLTIVFICMLSFLVFNGCSSTKEPKAVEQDSIETAQTIDDVQTVQTGLMNATGDRIGHVTYQQFDNYVLIHIQASSLPEGVHGIHIHEIGECEGPDFASAGGHFNPSDRAHGFNHPQGPHAGDLPNIYVAADGTVDAYMTANLITLEKGEPHSLKQDEGTSIIIHSDPDDYYSQPAGDAGERIACGKI